MSGSVGKRERKKPELYKPADFDSEAGETRSKKRSKDLSSTRKAGGEEETFIDAVKEPSSLLGRRISVRPSNFHLSSLSYCKAYHSSRML